MLGPPWSLTFSRPFPKVYFLMHFGRLWLTLGSVLPPFGSLLAPFGSLLVPLGSLFIPLWLTFGSLWFPLGSLLASCGSLLLSPDHCFRIFMYFRRKCHAKSYFYIISMKILCNISLFGKQMRLHRRTPFLCRASSPTRPGAEPWLCQL